MELPLFPLQTVLYPGLPIPLHVFEDRYRQMFKRILDTEHRFGVVAIVKGREVEAGATYHPIGCVAGWPRWTATPTGGWTWSRAG